MKFKKMANIEQINEEVLEEKHWHRVGYTGSNQKTDYVDVYAVDYAQAENTAISAASGYKRGQNSEQSFNRNVANLVYNASPVSYTDLGIPPYPNAARMLTRTDRSLRREAHLELNNVVLPRLAASAPNLAKALPDTDECLVHHINKKEYDNADTNLVILPYSTVTNANPSELAKAVHLLIHAITGPGAAGPVPTGRYSIEIFDCSVNPNVPLTCNIDIH